MHSLKKIALFAVTAAIVTTSAASAAPSAWNMPSGDGGHYTYSNGQTATGNFGSPMAFNGGFFFIPTSVIAVTAGIDQQPSVFDPLGPHAESNDTLSVILNAKPNQHFSRITSSFLGDYTIDGTGVVNSTGALRVTNLDTNTTLSSPLAYGGTVPAISLDGDTDGIFSGLAALDLPDGWTNIRVEMDGMVSSDSTLGTALIQGKTGDVGVVTAEIPIPAALAVAPVAAFFGWRAKRKFAIAR